MKTVIEIAREAGYPLVEFDGTPYIPPLLEMLIEAVRADEREACAKVCEDLPAPERMSLDSESFYECVTLDCADAIRARGSNT